MFKLRNGDLKLVVGFGASLIVLALLVFDFLKPLELLTYDIRFRLKPFHASSIGVNIAEISEDSIQALGRWPFARKFHGAFISVISKYKPKAILYDVLFTEPSDPIDDQTLAVALKQSGLVYLPYAFELEDVNGKIEYGKEFRPLPEFAEWAKGEGHINIQPDSDGVIRRIPLIIERAGKMYPSVALELVLHELGTDFNSIKAVKGKWLYIPHPKKGSIRIPIDDHYQMLINWNGRWKDTFNHYSFVEAIQAYKQAAQGIPPVIDLEKFTDQFCLVGLTAIGLTDLKPIPIEPVYPGVGVHATVIQNILEGRWIIPFGKKENGALLLILGIFTSLGLLRRRPVSGAVFTLVTVLVYLLISYLALVIWGIWISAVYPVAAIILNYFATTLYAQIMLAMEKNRLFNLATRDGLTGLYNIRHFKLLLEAEFADSKAKNKPLCVIMSDIDHFKKFNDTYGHQVGDLVIRDTGKVFRASGRELDIPARYGGEELIMMLPNTKLEDAGLVAERIRKNVESHEYKDEKGTYSVRVSLGVSCLENDESMDALIKRADDALYVSKEAGRNRVTLSQLQK